MAAIFQGLAALRQNNKYADLTVTCGEHPDSRTFNLHRAVVCSKSPFFDKACSGAFKEASTAHIDLKDDAKIFEKFIQFLYTGNYDDDENLGPQVQHCDEEVLRPEDEIQDMLRNGAGLRGMERAFLPDSEESIDFVEREEETDVQVEYDDRGICPQSHIKAFGDGLYRRKFGVHYADANGEFDDDNEEDSVDYEDDGDYKIDQLTRRPVDFVSKHSGIPCSVWELVYPDDDGYVSDLPHAMYTCIKLYAMADMSCVPSRKLLARNHFYRSAE
ncbi:hypothetical protein B0H66DRAFT_602737 [Apodospora peruviana]|uniref:BTB domain-containing protein n=1 Tax=Apodospora peruviana TaxID=516989 RepID=A0AAE0I498_9PEZI|nr:hypothetical protein B0H66DRAFT_602737 [Apodospora peruviana]